jgi:hypothetical protein
VTDAEEDGKVSPEEYRAERLAGLLVEMAQRFEELRRLVGPERSPMLYPAEKVTLRECSRAYKEAAKEVDAKAQRRGKVA